MSNIIVESGLRQIRKLVWCDGMEKKEMSDGNRDAVCDEMEERESDSHPYKYIRDDIYDSLKDLYDLKVQQVKDLEDELKRTLERRTTHTEQSLLEEIDRLKCGMDAQDDMISLLKSDHRTRDILLSIATTQGFMIQLLKKVLGIDTSSNPSMSVEPKPKFNFSLHDSNSRQATTYSHMIGQVCRHSGNGKDYEVLEIIWNGQSDEWMFVVQACGDPLSPKVCRGIDNFFSKRFNTSKGVLEDRFEVVVANEVK